MAHSIYVEAAWVLILFGATALLREASGELCVHAVSKNILSRTFLSAKDLDSLLSCTNGGRSMGFAAAWRLRQFYHGSLYLRIICCMPMLCWVIGMPIKLIAVSAFRENSTASMFDGHHALVIGIVWIFICMAVKMIAIFMSFQQNNFRLVFRERLSRVEALLILLYPLPAQKYMYDDFHVVGLSIAYDANGLNLQPYWMNQ